MIPVIPSAKESDEGSGILAYHNEPKVGKRFWPVFQQE
jgi:hypothetical protein